MTSELAVRHDTSIQDDQQTVYLFNPESGDGQQERPAKRKRVTRKDATASTTTKPSLSNFVPLLNGKESQGCVAMREQLFHTSWEALDLRIRNILRHSNSATLEEVSAFVENASTSCGDRIPSAFIITGPNIASQDLLFEQLADGLQEATTSRFVRLRSTDCTTLKATLKKVIGDATARAEVDEDEDDDAEDLRMDDGQDGRRYLDYDLEALHDHAKAQGYHHIFVAFQDSEGFDSGLLSDLIQLFSSWRPQIPLTLLFGIATSVELLQARLLKSAGQQIEGAQFDVVQAETILERVLKSVVATSKVPLQLSGPLLGTMLERQHNEIAGIQAFISALRYAYMCHFYANPLSVLCSHDVDTSQLLQQEHLEAIRVLASFRNEVEMAVNEGSQESLAHAQALIEDDGYLTTQLKDCTKHRQTWHNRTLRSLLLVEASGGQEKDFPAAYVEAIDKGVSEVQSSRAVESLRRMSAPDLDSCLRTMVTIIKDGTKLVLLADTPDEVELLEIFEAQLLELEQLVAIAGERDHTLRSQYSGHGKVMRTTVIAQKVQLSRDSAALRDEDKQYTEIVDTLTEALRTYVKCVRPEQVFLSEVWLYNSRSPSRDVFIPRPRVVFERGLTRPHDYLSCTCCKPEAEGLQPTLPATAILYQLYLETGTLINVTDLWTAFRGLVNQGKEEEDERQTLMHFYQGLAELKALGFVKATKKKTDHISKVKWL